MQFSDGKTYPDEPGPSDSASALRAGVRTDPYGEHHHAREASQTRHQCH